MGSTRLPIGLTVPLDRHQTATGALALAVSAEAAGIDRVCCGELASYDSIAVLAAIATATTRVALLSTVVSVLARSNALIAMGAQTLEALSAGRYILGLGAGSPDIGSWHRRALRQPIATMATALTEIRAALAGESVANTGFRMLTGAVPALPIYLAALNPRMIELAGSAADGVITTFAGPDQVRGVARAAGAAAERAGRRTPDVVATCWVTAGDDPSLNDRRLRETIAAYFTVPTYQGMGRQMAGDQSVALIERTYREHGRAAAAQVIPDRVMEQITVPATVEAVRSRIDSYAEAGATSVHFIPIRSDASNSAVERVISTLGEVARSQKRPRNEAGEAQ